MSDFKIGSIVVLKSGSPEMTVKKITRGRILCSWFEKDEIKQGEFQKDMLDKKEDEGWTRTLN